MSTKNEASQTGRGNGGGSDAPKGAIKGARENPPTAAKERTAARVNADARPTDNGDREAIPPSTEDRIYTADSKDTWDSDQPSFSDLLAERNKRAEKAAKSAK